MSTLYIYNANTGEILDTIEGSDNDECESIAKSKNWDANDEIGWSYNEPQNGVRYSNNELGL